MTLKAFTNYLWAGVGTGKGLEMIYLEVMPESPSEVTRESCILILALSYQTV